MILQILLLFAFVMAQVSPACAALAGGKSMIEICSADGTYKTISVSTQYDPVKKPETVAKKKCAFCFLQAQGFAKTKPVMIDAPVVFSSRYFFSSAGVISPLGLYQHSAQPRAPPVLI